MKTKFAVVYSLNTGRIRYEFHPDNDEQINDLNLLEGEGIKIFSNSEKCNLFELQEKINTHTGKIPSDDRYAIVDKNNNVVGAIIADPDGCKDQLENKQLVSHPIASSGWKYIPPTKQSKIPKATLINNVIENSKSINPVFPDDLGFSPPDLETKEEKP